MKTNPSMNTLQYVAMTKIDVIVQPNIPKLHILQFALNCKENTKNDWDLWLIWVKKCIIFSRQPDHVVPFAPNKMTTVICDLFCSPQRILHGFLGPRFGLLFDTLLFSTGLSHTIVTIFSHVWPYPFISNDRVWYLLLTWSSICVVIWQVYSTINNYY